MNGANSWQKQTRIGFSVKTTDELRRVVGLGANLVEIKTEKFAENGYPLWHYRGGVFAPNEPLLNDLATEAVRKSFQVNLHMPIEREVDPDKDTGINFAFLEHHEPALKRFIMIEEEIYKRYRVVGQVVTPHPPTISYGGTEVISETKALENAAIFFERWDKLRLERGHHTLIGLENQTDRKLIAGMVGNQPKHFKKMLDNTRTIGLTIDSGHRRLASEFSVSRFIGLGIPIVNFHFHGNKGEFRIESFDDDQHLPPTSDNVYGYDNYLRYFRRHKPTIVLELAGLKGFTDDELWKIIKDIRDQIDTI